MICLVAVALALWTLKSIIALLFLGFAIAAGMRPGVDWLRAHACRGRSGSFRVLGGATGLPPMIVLISATSAGIDVTVRRVDPAEQEKPTALFTAREGEG